MPLVQKASNASGAASSLTVNAASPQPLAPTTAGSLLVAIGSNAGSGAISISGWTEAVTVLLSTTSRISILYLEDAPSVTSVQMDVGSVQGAMALSIFEESGMALTGALDKVSSASASPAGTSQTSGTTATTAQADEVSFVGVAMGAGAHGGSTAATNSYTRETEPGRQICARKLLSATNTEETTISWTTSRANRVGAIATFKVDAGGATDLVIQDATHAHTAENQGLTQEHNLAVADAVHGHSADVQALTQVHNLTVADAAHSHAADNLSLTQAHNLGVANASHAHSADNLVLVPEGELGIAGGTHAHSADNLNLTQAHNLAIQDAAHAHTADNLVLASPFVIQDATHGHTADNLTLTQVHQLVIADATHAHAGDNVGLSSWAPVSRRVGTATSRRQLVATQRRGG